MMQLCHMFLSQMLVISIKLFTTVWNVVTLAELGSHISEPEYTALSGLFVWLMVKEPT